MEKIAKRTIFWCQKNNFLVVYIIKNSPVAVVVQYRRQWFDPHSIADEIAPLSSMDRALFF